MSDGMTFDGDYPGEKSFEGMKFNHRGVCDACGQIFFQLQDMIRPDYTSLCLEDVKGAHALGDDALCYGTIRFAYTDNPPRQFVPRKFGGLQGPALVDGVRILSV